MMNTFTRSLFFFLVLITMMLGLTLWYVMKLDAMVSEMQKYYRVAKMLEGIDDQNRNFHNSFHQNFDDPNAGPGGGGGHQGESKKEEDIPPPEEKPADYREFVMPTITGESVISMSLWGGDRRYTVGAIRNAERAKEFFPGWKLRIYTEMPSDRPRYGVVSQDIINTLREKGADIQYVDPFDTRVPPMMWRFLVADDMSVDHFIIRDTDSRLSGRDAAAVFEWIKSNAPFGCIRDHPSHAGAAVSGGLWGGKPSDLKDIIRRSWEDMASGFGADYYQDMSLLIDLIWPKVKNRAYCLDSVSCDVWPNAHPFPVPRYGYEHVGQVYNQHELGRPEDIRILRQTPVNSKCAPPRT